MSQNIAIYFFEFVAFLFAISFHEAAHAWSAARCGDPTAKMLGRVTLNPLRHIDPFGTVLIPIIGMLSHIGFIGWARPTPVDPRNFKRPVADDILVSLAGPASNIVLVIIFGSMLKLYLMFRGPAEPTETVKALVTLLAASVSINVILAIFNLIPVPPLDGSHVFRHFLSDSARATYDRLGTYGLMLLFIANMYFNFLGYIFRPAYALVDRIFLS